MKAKRFLALLTALVMVLGVMPGLAFAADGAALPLIDSYIAKTIGTGEFLMDDGVAGRPYAVSWSNDAGYRSGVVVFDASDLDKEGTAIANLTLTVYRTQNMNENTTSTVSVYAVDPAKVDRNNELKPDDPTAASRVGRISMAGLPRQDRDLSIPVTAEVNLAAYFAAYPEADKVALLLTNRDDISDSSSRGLVGFYGKNDAGYEPKLVPVVTTEANVTLKAGSSTLLTTEVKGLIIGDSYTPAESIAPTLLVVGDKLYTRGELPTITLGNGGNDVTVTYTEGASFTAIKDAGPMLPAYIAVVENGAIATVPANWTGSGTSYTAEIEGHSGVTASVELLDCEYMPDIFYCSGSSNGANFGWKTDLGHSYGGGTAVFEAVVNTGAGTNRLISYGNSTTGSFNGAGPVLRYRNAAVFEYYDGGWKQSTVACDANTTYRIRTEVDITNRTYRMYAAPDKSVNAQEITNGPAKFRNQSLAYIDRIFFHGDDLEQGVNNDVITSHCENWISGWSKVSVTYTAGDVTVAPGKDIKWTAGTVYTDSDAPDVVELNGKTYLRENVEKKPSITAEGESVQLNVLYTEVTVERAEAEANTVVGQAPVMPTKARVYFTDGQFISADVVWETTDIDVSKAGTFKINGTVTEYGIQAVCTVNVKEVKPDDGAELGKVSIATNNGGWNWYVEPSGTHIQPGDALATRYESGQYSTGGYKFQHDRTYMGWVEDDGSIVVAQYDHDVDGPDAYKRVVIHEKLESDDHNNPAVVVLPDGRIMAVYTMHTNEPYMYFRVTKNPEDISEWHAEQFYYCETRTDMETSSGYNATYPTVFIVHDDEGIKGNDVIYAGWRGVHWKPTLAKFPMPDENGRFGTDTDGQIVPVMGQTQFANTTYGYSTYDNGSAPNAKTDGGRTDSGRRPYTKYDYDFDENKIYITFTANHPDNDFRNHIYYLYLDIEDQNLYTAKDRLLQPLPKENQAEFASQGAGSTSGQWGVVTVDLLGEYPELLVFDATEDTNGAPFQPNQGSHAERRGWTWDISHNEKGEPCIVYADVTATPPGENGSLPSEYLAEVDGNTRSHHYYWYARWDSEKQEWVKTFLTYAGKWFHQNATQERCYSGGLTFDHNYPGNVIYLAIPTEGKYGNVFEIFRWESDDDGATWTKRQAMTEDSPVPNARPNAIYNYKQDPETGENLGPRLLWISGEYRYWMNYEYKTGVKTDFAGMITQDDPEMFADATLIVDGVEPEALPVGNATVKARFYVTNISIGDGEVKLALAHYDKDNALKNFVSKDGVIPARSVPQTSVLGADKDSNRANGLSAMGEPEVFAVIPYTADFEEGDKIKLFAWNMGIEHPMSSIMGIPYEISTDGNRYLFSENFRYGGDDKLVLDQNEDTFNGWVAKAYSGGFDYNNDWNYVAVTKAPFGNTGLHIYRHGDGGLMVSHKLPVTDGQPYTLEFTMRHIDEWSWNNTTNQGFTLSNGIPAGLNDSTTSHSAFQYRFSSAWQDENGRGTNGHVRTSLAFDGGSLSGSIFHNVPLARDFSNTDRFERYDYSKGEGYYDKQEQIYIHDYNDALYTGSLFRIKVSVFPELKQVVMSVNDGYRTASYSALYNGAEDFDWAANPIDTITFSIGNEKWGEVYIDDFRMYEGSSDGAVIRTVSVKDSAGSDLLGEGTWTMIPVNGAYAFRAADGNVIDVNGQGTTVGTAIGTWTYNGGDNQLFYVEEADGGVILRGKQSNLYVGYDANGTVSLQSKENATVFTIADIAEPALVDLEAYLAEIMA